jgi:hypothetical protein
MQEALVTDKADFVQLFLDNGVNLKRFLTVRTLWHIYSEVSADIFKRICVTVWPCTA